MNVEILNEKTIPRTTESINELMILYRSKWTTSNACIRIVHNCDMISINVGTVGLVESTRMEAAMRGKLILGMVK